MTKIGLTQSSEIKEKIVKIDENTAIRYRVVEEAIDLGALRQEKEALEEQLKMPEPTKEELLEQGKAMHPYYQDKSWIEQRIRKINSILEE